MGRKKAETETEELPEAKRPRRKDNVTKEEPMTPAAATKRTRVTGKQRDAEKAEQDAAADAAKDAAADAAAVKTAAKSKAAKAKAKEPFYTVEFIPDPNATAKASTKRKAPPAPPTEAEIERNKLWWNKVKKETVESASATVGAVAGALKVPANDGNDVTGLVGKGDNPEPPKVTEAVGNGQAGIAEPPGGKVDTPEPPKVTEAVGNGQAGIAEPPGGKVDAPEPPKVTEQLPLVAVAGAAPETMDPSFTLAPGVAEFLNDKATAASSLTKARPQKVQPLPLSVLDFFRHVPYSLFVSYTDTYNL